MAGLIGALRVSLSADTAAFSAGMSKAQREAARAGNAIQRSFAGIKKAAFGVAASGIIAGLSAGAIVALTKRSLEYAGSLGEVAQQLGVTTKELQTFRYAMQQNGGTIEESDKLLGKLSLSMSKAQAGSKQMQAAFGAVGVTLEDLRTKSRTDILGKIADGMIKTGGASANAAAGVTIFGKSFQKAVPLLDQGSKGINGLAAAAEKLGIVLTDEQIQKADKTADKLEALKAVLEARIAGVISDNAESIMSLAEALFSLAAGMAKVMSQNPQAVLSVLGALAGARFGGLPGAAIGGLAGFEVGSRMRDAGLAASSDPRVRKQRLNAARDRYNQTKKMMDSPGTRKQRQKAFAAWQQELALSNAVIAGAGRGPAAVGGGGDIADFLAPGGGRKGGAGDAERKRKDMLRDQARTEELIARAKIDELQAQQDLLTDYVDRNAISLQLIDLETEQQNKDLDLAVALGDMAASTAEQLKAKNLSVATLKKQAVIQQEELDRQRDYAHMEDLDFSIQRNRLDQMRALAETQEERRKVELELLDLAYREKRAQIERLKNSEDARDQEEGRRLELALPGEFNRDRAGVLAGTRGPLETFLHDLPNTAAKANEALESVAVGGLQSLTDGITDAIMGARSLGDVFSSVAKQIIADLIKIMVQKAIVGSLGNALGGLFGSTAVGGTTGTTAKIGTIPKYASGGSFTVGGRHGVDTNLLSVNGMPVANVSHGERVTVSNDNGAVRGTTIIMNGVITNDQFWAEVDRRDQVSARAGSSMAVTRIGKARRQALA